MCYPCYHLTRPQEQVGRAVVWGETRNRRPPRLAAQGGGDSRERSRQCLCSPTRHPGSFRCRYHLAEYVWGGRCLIQRCSQVRIL